jgi:hypothetical protein
VIFLLCDRDEQEAFRLAEFRDQWQNPGSFTGDFWSMHMSRLALPTSLLACSVMWIYFFQVMEPTIKAEAVQSHDQGKVLGDLFPSWYASRAFFLQRDNPYGQKVSREIYRRYYGTDLVTKGRNEQRFAYPFYTLFLLYPLIAFQFEQAQIVSAVVLLIAIASATFLWAKLFLPDLSPKALLILEAFVLSSHPALQIADRQQLSGLVIFCLALSGFLFARGYLVAAGFALALSSIKPQMALLPTAWMIGVAISNWKQLKKFVYSFAALLAALLGISHVLLPGWEGDFFRGMQAYDRYAVPLSIIGLFAGRNVGFIMGIVACFILAVLCWRWRKAARISSEFRTMLALVFATSAVFMPVSTPYNQLLILPAVLELIRHWGDLRNSISSRVLSICLAVTFWPWVGASIFLIYSFVGSVGMWWTAPFYLSLIFPLIVCYLVTKLRLSGGSVALYNPAT